MNPQAVTVGARLGSRLNPLILAAARRSPDGVSFFGGVISSILGAISGAIGPQTTVELARIPISRLAGQTMLEIPAPASIAIPRSTLEQWDKWLTERNAESVLPPLLTDEIQNAIRRLLREDPNA